MEGFNVLMYHEVINKEDFHYPKYEGIKVKQEYQDILPAALFVYVEEFKKQMKFLYEQGYVTLTLQDVINFYYKDKELPVKSVLLTFDDMYKSVLLYVYPILKEYDFHAVGFVVKDWLFDEVQKYSTTQSVCLSKRELEQMRDVFEYANHTTALHRRVEGQTILQTIDKNTFLRDLKECEEFVDSKHVFAYPFGVYTQENINWLKEENFLLAFTSGAGMNTREVNPYKLYRNGVLLEDDVERFKTKLESTIK